MAIQLAKLSAVWRCWWTLRVTIYSILLPLNFYFSSFPTLLFFFIKKYLPCSPCIKFISLLRLIILNVKFWSWQLYATYEMDGVISVHMKRCAFRSVSTYRIVLFWHTSFGDVWEKKLRSELNVFILRLREKNLKLAVIALSYQNCSFSILNYGDQGVC
jgi:hypothetical protein